MKTSSFLIFSLNAIESSPSLNRFISSSPKDISKYLQLSPVKMHCSMLAEDAIKMAIDDYKSKNNGGREN